MRVNSSQRIIVILLLLFIVVTLTYLTLVFVRIPMIAGDRILEVNGYPAALFSNVNKFKSIEWLMHLYIPGIPLLIFITFSFLLYMKRKHDPAAIMLIYFFFSIGMSYYSSTASHLSDPIGLTIIYVFIPIIPLLFMSDMNMYLRRFNESFISLKIMKMMFLLVGLVQLCSILYIWTTMFEIKVWEYIKTAYSGVVLLGHSICGYMLLHKFLKHKNTKLKSLFTITLVLHLIAFTPFATMNLFPLLVGQPQLFPAAFTALFLLVLPFVYYYLSTTNQLFDIYFMISRFGYYILVSLLPAIVIASISVIVLVGDEERLLSRWAGLFLITLAVTTIFLYAKEQMEQHFRPKLFKSLYSYQESLDRFSRNIARVMKQSDVEAVLKQEIGMLLPGNRVTFLIVDVVEQTVFPVNDGQEEKKTGDYLLDLIHTFKMGELIHLPYGLGFLIGKQRSRYHILWIGLKPNHTRFNSDEIRWLKTMVNYTSIVFENLHLIEGLIEDLETELHKESSTSPWVLRMLFCLSENERRRLAADLHDSALQDQLIWYRKLEAIMMDYPLSADMESELRGIKEGLLDVIHQIRETCNELRPPLLKEMGIVEAVESIIEHAQMRVNFEVQFRPNVYYELLDDEYITTIYRIVQELLRNADKHAGAKLVQLDLELRKREVYFRYEDDGVGMDVNHMMESFDHMGLSGIKERVASLEGHISFHSQRGKGMKVIIVIPLFVSSGVMEREMSRDSYLIS